MLSRLLFIFMLMALVACGPLVPLHHPPIAFESDEVKISLQFLERKHSHNIFTLEITNHLAEDLAFSPKAVSMFASPKPFPFAMGTESLDSISETFSKIIPARVWAKSREEVSQLTQNSADSRAALGVFFAILTVGAIVYDNAQDDVDNRKEYFTRRDVQRANTRDALVTVGRLSTEIAFSSANDALDYGYSITPEVFLDGHVWAGESKNGLIFIPNPTTYRYTRVIIPVNGVEYVFDFRLKGRKPPR
jgi:hypothetical protein